MSADLVSRPGIRTGLRTVLAQGAATERESTTLAAELVRIGLGRSDVQPARGDGRFKDPTWEQNPAYRRLAQSYLAACRAADNLVDNLEELDFPHVSTARFLTGLATSTLAPTNVLAGNPAR